MGNSNGFSDREAGRISNQMDNIEMKLENINDNIEEFMEEDYEETASKVQRHRTWFKILWGIVSTLGAGLMSIVMWIFRSKF